MYAQGVDSKYDLVWSYLPDGTPMTYGQVFLENGVSAYNFGNNIKLRSSTV